MKKALWSMAFLILLSFVFCNTGIACAADPPGYIDMYYAIQNDDMPRMKSLLKNAGKFINHDNGALLQGALGMLKSPQVIKLLLDAGANPNIPQTNTGNNALHTILTEYRPENKAKVLPIVKMLVAKGCSVNHKRNNDGYTPLHVAARNDHMTKDVFAALLAAKNLNVNVICNPINDTEDGAWPVLFYVVDRTYGTEDTNTAMATMLIAKGADLKFESTDKYPARRRGWTALHLVADAKLDKVDVVEALLAAGTPLDTPSKDSNMTPLHIALMADNPKICQLLLEKGADINVENKDGVSVIEHAKGYATDKHYKSAEVVKAWAASH